MVYTVTLPNRKYENLATKNKKKKIILLAYFSEFKSKNMQV